MIALLITLGLALIFTFYGIGVYNKLVTLRTLVSEAWSGIDVLLKKRYDLIPNLVETVKGYASHEKETFENVTKARNLAQAAGSIGDQEMAENQLNRALANLFVVAENYPELKANTNFMDLQNQLSVIESDIEKSRRYYNGTVRDQNILIDSFPSNLVANMFSFKKSDFFELDNPAERASPQVKF